MADVIDMSEWAPIPGFEGLYEASTDGRVRSLDRIAADGKWHLGVVLKAFLRKDGHLMHSLRDTSGKRFSRYAHQLVLSAFAGACPPGMECCHRDGNPINNHVSNLYWGTRSDNMRDRVLHANLARDRNVLNWDTSSDTQLDNVRLGIRAVARKTHCLRGHLLAEPNLYRQKSRPNVRFCVACRKIHDRARAARRAARAAS